MLLRRRIRRWPLHIWMFLLRFGYLKTLRMSTKRLSVMLFVFSFRVTVISCYLLRGVPVVAEEFFLFTSARRRENCTTFHSLLLIILLSTPP